MATYVNDLRLKEIGTGESSGTWGTETNVNLELIGEALSFGTEAITTNADTHTSTVADGATDPARSMFIKYTGTLDSACTITIAPNTLSRVHFIENGTSGSQNIIISQGSGANVTIPPGDVKVVYLDGAGSGAAVVDAFASLSVVDLKVQDDLTVTDDMTVGGTLGVTGVLTATSLDISGDIDVDGTTNLDVVDIDGAVDMASTLAVGGVLTANAGVVVDNITIDGTEIDLSSGTLTLDVAGNIELDADGGQVIFMDGGTNIGRLENSSSDFIIKSMVDDKDIIFKGEDGGSGITALTLDMSNAGRAFFNVGASFSGDVAMGDNNTTKYGVGEDLLVSSDGTDGKIVSPRKIKIDAADEIHLDSDSGIVRIQDDAGDIGMLQMTSADFIIRSMTSDKDLVFKGNDGGSVITALTLDMSEAGHAKFNKGISFNNDTAAANILDDYEEGDFTLVISVEGQGNATIGSADARYTKIGELVHVQFDTGTISNVPSPSSSRAWQFSGLPFTNSNFTVPITVRALSLNADANFGLTGQLLSSNTLGRIEIRTATTVSNASPAMDGARAFVSIVYPTHNS
jgi:cytoskeletal protein CcmA (bactofilin family)